MAAAALAWTLGRPSVASLLIGASRPEQVASNIAALDVALTTEQRARLDQVSAPEPIYPFALAMPATRRFALGGDVLGWDEQA